MQTSQEHFTIIVYAKIGGRGGGGGGKYSALWGIGIQRMGPVGFVNKLFVIQGKRIRDHN